MKRSPLLPKPAPDRSGEPGYRQWKAPVTGPCQVCGTVGRLVRHHVILEQHVRALGGDPYDLRNSLLIGAGYVCRCHREHHGACRRIPRCRLSAAAVEFAVELLGPEGGEDYLERYYG